MRPATILVLAGQDPWDLTTGTGILTTHTVRCLVKLVRGVSVVAISDRVSSRDGQVILETEVMVRRPPHRRKDLLRALFRGPLTAPERQFMEEVHRLSADADAALWFGSSWDPITTELPAVCACPLYHHPNDSIALFERNRVSARLQRGRIALSAAQERRVLTAGYAGTIYVSATDRDYSRLLLSNGTAAALHVLPNGVDMDTFYPPTERASAVSPITLLFTGVLEYKPNVDAVRYLINDVLPLVTSTVQLAIVGRSPTAEVRELATRDPRIVLRADVDTIAEEYRQADIFVAPMRSGAGIKNKVLEALATGLPVVTTPDGVQGFPAVPPGIVVGRGAAELAAVIDNLVATPDYRHELGRAARAYIVDGWAWEARTEKLANLLLPE
jgi:glycosyltransferase involved in cell wall biosynthesis